MFGGTSTGSLLSAGLVTKDLDNPMKPKLTAEQGMQVYIDGAKFIFTPNGWRYSTHVLLLIAFGGLFASLFYYCGRQKYHNKTKLNSFDTFEKFLDEIREMNQIKEMLEDEEEKLFEQT